MAEQKHPDRDTSPLEQRAPAPDAEGPAPTSKRKRILALIGAILAILLTLAYTYSLATGAFLKW